MDNTLEPIHISYIRGTHGELLTTLIVGSLFTNDELDHDDFYSFNENGKLKLKLKPIFYNTKIHENGVFLKYKDTHNKLLGSSNYINALGDIDFITWNMLTNDQKHNLIDNNEISNIENDVNDNVLRTTRNLNYTSEMDEKHQLLLNNKTIIVTYDSNDIERIVEDNLHTKEYLDKILTFINFYYKESPNHLLINNSDIINDWSSIRQQIENFTGVKLNNHTEFYNNLLEQYEN